MTYWQIAAGGSSGRHYPDFFLKHGLACVGGEKQTLAMSTIQVGDIVLLKVGKQVYAAGTVVSRNGSPPIGCGDKEWLRDFDGWDLAAYCLVDWHVPAGPINNGSLTRSTISKVDDKTLRTLAHTVINSSPPAPAPQPDPAPTKKVSDAELLEYLLTLNLRAADAVELTAALSRIRLLARYYYTRCKWEDVREHETRTFLVIPLLLALGWSEQQTKIEVKVPKGRVDVALFDGPYHGDAASCRILIETKGFSQGLAYAPQQAAAYAHHFPNCHTVLVTNGFCYKSFSRNAQGVFSTKTPTAYLNLLDPRSRYPLDPINVDGCLKTLQYLLDAV